MLILIGKPAHRNSDGFKDGRRRRDVCELLALSCFEADHARSVHEFRVSQSHRNGSGAILEGRVDQTPSPAKTTEPPQPTATSRSTAAARFKVHVGIAPFSQDPMPTESR